MAPATHPHIVIIDDNEEILETLSILFKMKSFRVSVKKKMDNFLPDIQQLKPDLIILDKFLGWADGCALCRQLKAEHSLAHVPVIMFSANYKKNDECRAAGANAFLEKPFEMKLLLETIQSLLNTPGVN
jgi:two-component system, OmpR family, phosphate regulon response regulator PhoB